ncbi:MAG: cyclic nucleotide-binding domain-containing protein [Proteobacteria bacterium]|nr:cyclic nucleotide-binding domain-containing protein [Pseudomonadota bacterium]
MTSRPSIKELEKRLHDEPDNIGLRVTVAGALHEAGRKVEAVELYRSVAFAYRDQGRSLQAIAVCKSLLAIAPEDLGCKALLAQLNNPAPAPAMPREELPSVPPASEPEPPRRPEVLLTRLSSSIDETPLPGALPYHVADPTASMIRISPSEAEVSEADLPDLPDPLDLTPEPRTEPGENRQVLTRPSLVSRAVRPSTDTFTETEPILLATPDPDHPEPLTTRIARISDAEDDPDAPPRLGAVPSQPIHHETMNESDTIEDEQTRPLDTSTRRTAIDPFSTTFFSHLPVDRRAAALSRFHRRTLRAGEAVITRGAVGHPFVLVLRGELAIAIQSQQRRTAVMIGPGDYAGEDALLARAPSALSTGVATTEASVLLLLPADFYEIVGAFPALWAELKATAALRA